MLLEEILNHIHNFFVVRNGVHRGNFVISSNTISLDFLQDGQYFRIVGSVFNDGVYQYPAEGLHDEEFFGEIWAMAIPDSFIALYNDINAWDSKYKDALESPYQSESWKGYSYTKASVVNGNGGTSDAGWQYAFKSRLNPWRKIS
jgi:hypothetical protein